MQFVHTLIHWQGVISNLPKMWRGSMLNLASPELNPMGCQTSRKAHESSTAVDFCRQRKETAVKSSFLPKRDLGKVILWHDPFRLFLHGTKRSDVHTVQLAEHTQPGRVEKEFKASLSPTICKPRMDQVDAQWRFWSLPGNVRLTSSSSSVITSGPMSFEAASVGNMTRSGSCSRVGKDNLDIFSFFRKKERGGWRHCN